MGTCAGPRGRSGGLWGTHYGQNFSWRHTHIFCCRY